MLINYAYFYNVPKQSEISVRVSRYKKIVGGRSVGGADHRRGRIKSVMPNTYRTEKNVSIYYGNRKFPTDEIFINNNPSAYNNAESSEQFFKTILAFER